MARFKLRNLIRSPEAQEWIERQIEETRFKIVLKEELKAYNLETREFVSLPPGEYEVERMRAPFGRTYGKGHRPLPWLVLKGTQVGESETQWVRKAARIQSPLKEGGAS